MQVSASHLSTAFQRALNRAEIGLYRKLQPSFYVGCSPFKTSSVIRHWSSKNSSEEASWEDFEFGTAPKSVFAKEKIVAADKGVDLDLIYERERKEDEIFGKKLQIKNQSFETLSQCLVANAIQTLSQYVRTERQKRIENVLNNRTKNCRFLFENPVNPSNIWACLRTLDSFGIQYVDIVVNSELYRGRAAMNQKKGMRTAMGSAKWLSLRSHPTSVEAIQKLKGEGFKIIASDLSPTSRDIRDFDWSKDQQPICIVMGNENSGISEEMRSLADETFTLPMCGFAESFNLSVATAITLAHLSAASNEKDSTGPLRPGDLSNHEKSFLTLKGLLNSLPKKHKMGINILRKSGINIPEEILRT